MQNNHLRKINILLVNLGTPSQPTSTAIRRFLREFLSDPRVVELPRWIWLPLLYLYVLPLRPGRLVRAYQKIWRDTGSPIRFLGKNLAANFNIALNRGRDREYQVCYTETYGDPDIPEAMARIMDKTGAEPSGADVVVLPLYPQYSGSVTGAVSDQIMAWMTTQRVIPRLQIIPHYYNHPAYIEALAARLHKHWQIRGRGEKLLISFHGLPVSMIEAGDPYERQCRSTAQLLAAAAGLKTADYQVAFQSRFGKAAWIKPSADVILKEWGSGGLQSVDVLCPGFAVDCLETLEEMGIQNKQLFHQSGGGEYRLIACLNDTPEHVECLTAIIDSAVGNCQYPVRKNS